MLSVVKILWKIHFHQLILYQIFLNFVSKTFVLLEKSASGEASSLEYILLPITINNICLANFN